MDTSSFNEGTLAHRYEFLHFRRETEGGNLADDFREGMYETVKGPCLFLVIE